MLAPTIERFKVKRKVDDSGKIWIPKLFSRLLNLQEENRLCLVLENGSITIKKKEHYIEEDDNYFLVHHYGDGKLTIPKLVRKELGILKNSLVAISLDVDKLYVSKCDNICIVCNSTKNLLYNNNIVICEDCIGGFVTNM